MIRKAIVLFFVVMTGCDRQKVVTPDEDGYENRSIIGILETGKFSIIHSIIRKIPWETMEPDLSFARVTHAANDMYSITPCKSSWKFSAFHGIETGSADSYKSDINIHTNVDARAYLETYVGCDLTFPSVVSLDHVLVSDSISVFRLVRTGFQKSSDKVVLIVDVDTFVLKSEDGLASTQISGLFRFFQDITLADLRTILHNQCREYMGICKQVELLNGKGQGT